MKSVNQAGGKNRLRFENFSHRLRKLNADVVHRVHHESSRSLSVDTPDSGSMGCFFQDELEQCKALDVSSTFKRFYYSLLPFVQSLPELLHHKEKVVDLLVLQLTTVDSVMLPSYLKLMNVLARFVFRLFKSWSS